MKKLLFIACLLLGIVAVNAQDSKNIYSGSFFVGSQTYFGQFRTVNFDFNETTYGCMGVSYAKYIDSRYDLNVSLSVGEFGYQEGSSYFRSVNEYLSVGVKIKMNTAANAKWVPYFLPSLGIFNMSQYTQTPKSTTWISPAFALGLTYKFTPEFAMYVQENVIAFRYTKKDMSAKNHNALDAQTTIGFTYSFGCTAEKKQEVVTEDVTNKTVVPEVSEKSKQILQAAISGVQFETAKDVIKTDSYKILDDVVTVMKENPAYKLGIYGHTDNTGKEDENMVLSEKRAIAVKAYLVSKGVEVERLTAKGFGQTQPIADNGTAEGRAKNRRVEFKIEF